MLLFQFGNTALHYACRDGHTEVVRHLINNNADISATNDVSGLQYVYCIANYLKISIITQNTVTVREL